MSTVETCRSRGLHKILSVADLVAGAIEVPRHVCQLDIRPAAKRRRVNLPVRTQRQIVSPV